MTATTHLRVPDGWRHVYSDDTAKGGRRHGPPDPDAECLYPGLDKPHCLCGGPLGRDPDGWICGIDGHLVAFRSGSVYDQTDR